MDLSGKVALVTGASRGIGRALVVELARRGCGLRLTGLEGDDLAEVAEHATASFGVAAAALSLDLTADSAPGRLVDWLADQPPPDLLVNNAGGGRFGRFVSASDEDIEHTLRLNVLAPTRLIRSLLPILGKRPEAAIVNVSSAIARLPYPGLAVYGAAKGYLSSLSESLACELIGTDVRVLCFHPGFTATGFMAAAGMDMRRIPGWAVVPPERVAARIVRAIEHDRAWDFSGGVTRLGASLARVLPQGLKMRLFENLFWELPPWDGSAQR